MISGDKTDLIREVTSGAAVRVLSSNNYLTSIQNAVLVGDDVCAQALFHVGREDNSRFKDKAYWYFVLLCTSGHWDMSRYNVGEHVSRGHSQTRKTMSWFVRESCFNSPILSLHSNGTISTGTIERVVNAVKNAEDIRISTEGKYFFPADKLEYGLDETMVVATAAWHISQQTLTVDGTRLSTFLGDDDVWQFSLTSTDGGRSVSRWNIGDHVSRGASCDKVSTDWVSDCCWNLIYKHYRTGAKISGSLSALVNAVKGGHKIKIVHQRMSLEADEIQIRQGHICATFLSIASKSGTGKFSTTVGWAWKIACTTGSVKTLTFKVGSSLVITNTTEAATLAWFIDDRKWQKVLSNTANGEVSYGSRGKLQTAIRGGAEVSYRVILDKNETEFSVIHQADNLKLWEDNVSAMHIRSISLDFDGLSEVKFKMEPFWCFTIVTTSGGMDMSRWRMGVHIDKGHTGRPVVVEWFISG